MLLLLQPKTRGTWFQYNISKLVPCRSVNNKVILTCTINELQFATPYFNKSNLKVVKTALQFRWSACILIDTFRNEDYDVQIYFPSVIILRHMGNMLHTV